MTTRAGLAAPDAEPPVLAAALDELIAVASRPDFPRLPGEDDWTSRADMLASVRRSVVRTHNELVAAAIGRAMDGGIKR